MSGVVLDGALEPNLGERGSLPRGHVLDLKALDRLIEQTIEIQFRRQMQEHAPRPIAARSMNTNSRGTVTVPGLERLMHTKGFLAPVFGRLHPVAMVRTICNRAS